MLSFKVERIVCRPAPSAHEAWAWINSHYAKRIFKLLEDYSFFMHISTVEYDVVSMSEGTLWYRLRGIITRDLRIGVQRDLDNLAH